MNINRLTRIKKEISDNKNQIVDLGFTFFTSQKDPALDQDFLGWGMKPSGLLDDQFWYFIAYKSPSTIEQIIHIIQSSDKYVSKVYSALLPVMLSYSSHDTYFIHSYAIPPYTLRTSVVFTAVSVHLSQTLELYTEYVYNLIESLRINYPETISMLSSITGSTLLDL